MKPVVKEKSQAVYHPCLWSYFRAVRFAGDFTALGTEIQIDDYEIDNNKLDDGNKESREQDDSSSERPHLRRQRIFAEKARTDDPFDVESFRDLLTG